MLVIGKIIKKTGSEFSIIKTEINMKEGGLKIRDMGKEHFGFATRKIN